MTLTAAASLTATGLCAQKAKAATPTETELEQLLSPSSYEQYLSLTAPKDAAATDRYVAIADGNTLFCFDRSVRGVWQKYEHTNSITKLQFAGKSGLYFLDGQTNELYSLDVYHSLESASPVKTGIVCSTFSIHGDTLYYINVSAGQSSVYSAPLDDLSSKKEIYSGRMYSPALSFWNGEIYYVYGTDYLHKLHPETGVSTKVAELPAGVLSMTITEGVLLCATESGGFYGYSLSDLTEKASLSECTPLVNVTDGYSSVSANGNEVLLIRGNTVRQFSLEEKNFTAYEIGSASDSIHRLNGGSEVLLSGNTLFISDDNNDRISVYDVKENSYKAPIPSDLDAPFMSAYGDTLLTATASQAILYSIDGSQLAALPPEKIGGNIVGTASVYGTYYLVTDTNYCYTLTKGGSGYEWTETLRKAHYAEKLTADAQGFLYILNDGAVYRYTEENFLSPTEEGEKICRDIPASTTKISVDYAGNLYALADNGLYTYALQADGTYAEPTCKTFDNEQVYGTTPKAISYTFGIEENAVYILYENNYLTVSEEFALPTVKNIPAEKVAEDIFAESEGSFSLVQTLPNTLLVQVDIQMLDGKDVFPYLGYTRSQAPLTALKIGETADYALLSYRENTASDYKTVLVAKSRQTNLDGDYTLTYDAPSIGYLTNVANAYKYPCMGLPKLSSFEKNAQVTLLGEIRGLDCEYYTVSLEDSKAYLPKSYVTLFNGAPPATEELHVGEPTTDKDSIWRLAYLVLGAGVICILIDMLILRKKEDEEE